MAICWSLNYYYHPVLFFLSEMFHIKKPEVMLFFSPPNVILLLRVKQTRRDLLYHSVNWCSNGVIGWLTGAICTYKAVFDCFHYVQLIDNSLHSL